MGVFWFNKIVCTETLPTLKTGAFKPNEKVFRLLVTTILCDMQKPYDQALKISRKFFLEHLCKLLQLFYLRQHSLVHPFLACSHNECAKVFEKRLKFFPLQHLR